MVLIYWERFKAMQGVDTKIQNIPADVEIKLRRQKTLRKMQHSKEPARQSVNLSPILFSTKKRKKPMH